MAKKSTKKSHDEESEDFVALPIEYYFPDNLPGRFANYMTVQHDGHEFHISFFEIRPPLALGTPEERKEKLETLKSVRAECVARIIVSEGRMPAIVTALQDNLEKQLLRKTKTNVIQKTAAKARSTKKSNDRKR